MHIITKLRLENDLDLMLAHKRSMQITEFVGLTIVNQTSFATAVSEICRLMMDSHANAEISFGLRNNPGGVATLSALIRHELSETLEVTQVNVQYAAKLVSQLSIEGDRIELICELGTRRLGKDVISRGQQLFEELPAVTPYEEAKKMNVQLQQLAERVVESEKRYQMLNKTLPLMMFTLDHEGNLIFANEGFNRFARQPLQPPVALNWLKWFASVQEQVTLEILRRKLTHRVPLTLEVLLRLEATEQKHWHLLSLTPITNEISGLTQWFGFLVNVNAQKVVDQTLKDNAELIETKNALEKRQKELDATIVALNKSNQELAQFAYVASHDLQEPARKMVILSDILLSGHQGEESLPNRSQELLGRVKKASLRMVHIIQDLLAYSRIADGQQMQQQETNLADLVQAVKETLDEQILSRRAEIIVTDNVRLTGNRSLLILLIQNLVSNALKFSGNQKFPVIEIESLSCDAQMLRDHGLDENQRWNCMNVIDNGIGFEQQHAEKIFHMFQRLHNREVFEGTGIGLSICKRIVEMHQGKITAKGQVGKGATFAVFLPASSEATVSKPV